MVQLGKLHEFQPDTDELCSYLERVDFYFAANDVPDGKKVPVLLNCIGGGTYGVLRGLLAPESPMSKSYDELVTKLREHFEPKTVIIAERFQFHKRNQRAAENIAEYLAELRRLAARCEFGASLNKVLRDRFVCGLKDESVLKTLLAIKDLTLSIAVEKARSTEAVKRNAQKLKNTPLVPVGSVERDGPRPTRSANHRPTPKCSSRKVCNRCGKADHSGQDCWLKEAMCPKCGKKRPYSQGMHSGISRQKPVQQVQSLTPQSDKESPEPNQPDDFLGNVNTVGSRRVNPYKAVLEIEGKPVQMEIDTGAAVRIEYCRIRRISHWFCD